MLTMKNHKILNMKSSHSKNVYELQIKNKPELGSNIWKDSEIKNLLDKENSFCMISLNKSNISGFCLFLQIHNSLELYTIFVAPNFRNQGIAKLFLKKAKHFCKKNLLKGIFLEVKENNYLAISLYKNQDFNLIGRRKDYYCKNGKFFDALLMSYDA